MDGRCSWQSRALATPLGRLPRQWGAFPIESAGQEGRGDSWNCRLRPAPGGHGNENLTVVREFYRVAHQVDDDLADSSRVAKKRLRYVGFHLVDELQSLLMSTEAQYPGGFTQILAQIKRDRLKIEFAGFDLRE